MSESEVGGTRRADGSVWVGATVVAGLGTYVMYDAIPGVNWLLWTLAASIGLCVVTLHRRGRLDGVSSSMCAAAVAVAGGAVVTANPVMHALICLAVMLFLALAMLLSADPRLERVTAWFVLKSPVVAGGFALFESIWRVGDASRLVGTAKTRSALRGAAIAVPVVAFFALLLSAADPLFALWRVNLITMLETWSFLPRATFFVALLVLVVGAFGFAARRERPDETWVSGTATPARWLGETERLILLASVAGLFWIFLAVQLSYLFGNLPRVTGSGMTFAEYARRGFAELTVVASCSVVLIVLSERYGRATEQIGRIRMVTVALIVAVFFLMFSAFRRVSLYEAAYGYTTARLYAQAYMLVIAITLLALALEVRGEMDSGRLFRRTGAAALAAFLVLIYWNHEAWIARENIDRFATTGKLDVVYLTRDLSPDALPTIAARLPDLPEPARTQLLAGVRLRHPARLRIEERKWYEWNWRRDSARGALRRMGISQPSSIIVR